MKIYRHARRHPHPEFYKPAPEPTLIDRLAAFMAYILAEAAKVERIEVTAAKPIRNDYPEATAHPLAYLRKKSKGETRSERDRSFNEARRLYVALGGLEPPTAPLNEHRQHKLARRLDERLQGFFLNRFRLDRYLAEWQQRCNGGDAVRPGSPVRPPVVPAVA